MSEGNSTSNESPNHGEVKKGEAGERAQEMMVTVPDGAKPGQLIQFKAPDGTMMQVPVPESKMPGDEFQVQLRSQRPTVVSLKVPEGVEPGGHVQFTAPDGTRMKVSVPEDKRPGDEFQVVLSPPQLPTQYKLTVPEGVKAGEDFKFQIPDGSQMRTKVPDGLQAGDTFSVALKLASTDVAAATSSDVARQRDGLGQLCSAVGSGDLEAVKKCVEAGVPVNGVYDAGFTPLFYAATDGRPDVATWLLEQKADVHAQNSEQRTPLHWAARNNHLEVMRLLIAARARTDVEDNTGRTPLKLAMDKGHPEAAKLLQEI